MRYALAMLAVIASTTHATSQQSYASDVITKCSPDALRLCPEHALGSSELRYCMEAKARMISRDCLVALEDDGVLPRGTVRNAQAKAR